MPLDGVNRPVCVVDHGVQADREVDERAAWLVCATVRVEVEVPHGLLHAVAKHEDALGVGVDSVDKVCVAWVQADELGHRLEEGLRWV